MDYLGWELERQRAALWALLGGGEAGEEGESLPPREDPSARGREDLAGGTRRSPAGPERAGRPGAGRAGRYAAGRERAGVPPVGGPGAWETAREAAGDRPDKAPEGPEAPVSAWEQISGEEAGALVRGGGDAETGVPVVSRQEEEVRRTPRFGTGGEPLGPSGGPGTLEAVWRTAAEAGAEARLAAEAAGGRRAERAPAAGGPVWEAGPSSGGRPGGGEAAGDTFAITRRGGTGMAGQGGLLPWGGEWESAALWAEAEARALSRAVQRDARRYDGGFTIY